MLQQTRVAAVIPYYERFLARFPSVGALARAQPESVLRLWAGLGYYTRARNLHLAAKQIVERHHGEFPRQRDAALQLAGIGEYTSAAILSIAYDAPHAVLDGNVARVLARLGAIRGDLREPRRWKRLSQHADALLMRGAAGDWNEAMMELGATVCTPSAPRCDACPVRPFCRAYALGITDKLPAKRVKRAPVELTVAASVLLDTANRTLLVRPVRHSAPALFSRMWQFPAVEVATSEMVSADSKLRECLASLSERGRSFADAEFTALPPAGHAVTFRKITLAPFLIRVAQLPTIEGARALPLGELNRVAVSSATRKIAKAAVQYVASSRTPKSRAAAR